MLIISLTVSIIYIIRYAEKVRKNPKESLVYGTEIPSSLSSKKLQEIQYLNWKSKCLLTVFGLSFVIMIIGVSQWGWWFQEMTTLFFISSR